MQASDQLNTMAALSLRKEHPQGPLYRKLGWPHSWPEHDGIEENPCP
jgi:hypothetical protein